MEINVVNGSYTVQRLAIIPYSAFLRFFIYTKPWRRESEKDSQPHGVCARGIFTYSAATRRFCEKIFQKML